MDAIELAKQIELLEKNIKLANAATRLRSNPDFNVVFTEDYLKSYPLALVNELGTYTSNSDAALEVVDKLRAVSFTEAYLNNLIDQGQLSEAELHAAKAIPDSELY